MILKKEIENYCIFDVDILSRAYLRFMSILRISTGVDTFQCITIASVCMGVFRSQFLEARLEVVLCTPEGKEIESILTFVVRIDGNAL